jgi:integrase/recombinase XerD
MALAVTVRLKLAAAFMVTFFRQSSRVCPVTPTDLSLLRGYFSKATTISWAPWFKRDPPIKLIRAPRTLPRVINPDEVDALLAALRTRRDRAMVEAMLVGGLRRCEVVGLRLEDLRPGDKRVFIAEGKGGHQRIVPLSSRFFLSVAAYLEIERPRPASTDRVFVVLKGPRRGQPLTAAGLDEIVTGARTRAGLVRLTCHQLRHTCFTRLREAGMALEAIQAQAGHRSIESTRIYLHLANDWLAGEYRRAAEAIDAQAAPSV